MAKLNKIKTKLSIHSKRRSMLMLEGEYVSLLKGKSLDFDDLREYAYGDDVRDIDWRASAKQQIPLVKRYVANRRHNVLFVVDSSITMLGATSDYQPKYELASEAVGLLGYVAAQHNDNLSLLTATPRGFESLPYMGGERHLNRILDKIEEHTQSSQSIINIKDLLQQAYRIAKNRTIMVVIADEFNPDGELKNIIRKLQHKHDVLWVSIADINPVSIPKTLDVLDVVDIIDIPDALRADEALLEKMQQDDLSRKASMLDFLKSLHVTNTVIATSNEVIPTLTALLKRREREQR